MKMPPHNKTTKYEHVIPQLVAIEEQGYTRPAADTEYCGRRCGSRLAIAERSPCPNRQYPWCWAAATALVYPWL